MPTAKNVFHILNLHPKKYIKKTLFLMTKYLLKKISIIFITQTLDATAKNDCIFEINIKSTLIKKEKTKTIKDE